MLLHRGIREDGHGNAIEVEVYSGCRILFLRLGGGGRRRIGVIELGRRVLRCTRVRRKHLMRKLNAYGFCDKILREAKLFDFVELDDGNGLYRIPVSVILGEGRYLNFKTAGFELQVFVTLDTLRKYSVSGVKMFD